MSRKNPRIPDLYPVSGRHPRQEPRNPAADPEYEQSQPINRNDRKAMLRRHFEAGGMTDAETDTALSKAKV